MAGADGHPPIRTVVVDTRGELGFENDDPRLCLDVLRGYPRARGVEIATRTLSAQLIVCDEIGDVEEAMALISTHHGGVPIVASAHGGTVGELLRRTGIRLLHESRLFGAYVGIRRNGRGDFHYRITSHAEADRQALGQDLEDSALPAGSYVGGEP
jgi:stage III sporulation protein SpoIIIAA